MTEMQKQYNCPHCDAKPILFTELEREFECGRKVEWIENRWKLIKQCPTYKGRLENELSNLP